MTFDQIYVLDKYTTHLIEHPVVECFIVKTYHFSLFILIYKLSKLLTLIKALHCYCCLQHHNTVSPLHAIKACRRSFHVSPIIFKLGNWLWVVNSRLRSFTLVKGNLCPLYWRIGSETFWTYWRRETPLSLPGSKPRTVRPVISSLCRLRCHDCWELQGLFYSDSRIDLLNRSMKGRKSTHVVCDLIDRKY